MLYKVCRILYKKAIFKDKRRFTDIIARIFKQFDLILTLKQCHNDNELHSYRRRTTCY